MYILYLLFYASLAISVSASDESDFPMEHKVINTKSKQIHNSFLLHHKDIPNKATTYYSSACVTYPPVRLHRKELMQVTLTNEDSKDLQSLTKLEEFVNREFIRKKSNQQA